MIFTQQPLLPLLQEIASLFGAKTSTESLISGQDDYVKLSDENRKHGLSLTLPRSTSSVFRTGVIGKGLKPKLGFSVLKRVSC